MSILITGGAGFIGSHVVRRFVTRYPDTKIVCLDALTYAGNLENLADIDGAPNYAFVKADICDAPRIRQIFSDYDIHAVIHLAAESHVDRSIEDPLAFARTNVLGTLTLLDAARHAWPANPENQTPKTSSSTLSLKRSPQNPSPGNRQLSPDTRQPSPDRHLFYHISTDEVYGSLSLPESGLSQGEDSPKKFFTESTPYDPHSPYSASKASSDHFVRAYHDTYGLPTIITNCSNNYGPNQFPEKLIPLFINNIRLGKPLPVYGRGENVRDWLYVEDHAAAIDLIFHEGRVGDTYNIGGFNEWRNIDLIRVLIRTVDRLLGRPEGHSDHLITYVTDRPGHDLRYAIDATKLNRELGWEPSLQFEEGIEKTVRWYLDNQEWSDRILSGAYRDYYDRMYGSRLDPTSLKP